MTNTNNGMSTARKTEIGAGIAAGVAAAAIGAYFLYGAKDAKRNRAKVKGWMLKAKGDILEQMENMEEVTQEGYEDIVNRVIANYRGVRNVSAPELMALAADARKHWKALKPMFSKGKKSTGAARKGSARRSASKGASKSKSGSSSGRSGGRSKAKKSGGGQ